MNAVLLAEALCSFKRYPCYRVFFYVTVLMSQFYMHRKLVCESLGVHFKSMELMYFKLY